MNIETFISENGYSLGITFKEDNEDPITLQFNLSTAEIIISALYELAEIARTQQSYNENSFGDGREH